MGSSFSIVNDTNTDIFVYESPSAELLEAMANPFVILNPFDPKNQPTRHLPPGQTYSSGKIKGLQVPKTVLLENGFNKERKSRLLPMPARPLVQLEYFPKHLIELLPTYPSKLLVAIVTSFS